MIVYENIHWQSGELVTLLRTIKPLKLQAYAISPSLYFSKRLTLIDCEKRDSLLKTVIDNTGLTTYLRTSVLESVDFRAASAASASASTKT